MSSALLLLGDLSYLGGDISRARAYQEESLALSREAGSRRAVSRRFTRLGQIARLSGEHEHAALLFKESLALSREGGDRWCVAMTLAGMAGLARASGQLERAVSLLGATQVFLESFGTQLWPLDRIEYETNLSGLRAQLSEQAFERAWSRGSAFETNNLDQIIQFAMSELEQFGIDAGSEEQQPGLPSQTALQAAKREFGGLTRREREVAVLIVQGKSNAEIAALLFVGRRTVEAHVTHILNKLGFRSRTQIAGWAVEKGLAAPSKGLIKLDQDSNF
jgi:non-specific serine/threonine protein kinase